ASPSPTPHPAHHPLPTRRSSDLAAATAPAASAQDVPLRGTAEKARLVDLQTAPEVAPVPRPADLVTNRPTIPMADYIAAKNAARSEEHTFELQSPYDLVCRLLLE